MALQDNQLLLHGQRPVAGLSKDSTPEDLAELYDRYAPCLYGLLLRSVKAPQKAEDQLENCFLLLWNSRASCTPAENVFPWMLRTLLTAGVPLHFPEAALHHPNSPEL